MVAPQNGEQSMRREKIVKTITQDDVLKFKKIGLEITY